MNILVVEDDPIMGMMVSAVLEDLGHTTTIKQNGVEAWEAIQKTRFEVVISDWVMPQMDGLELCRHLRAHFEDPYTYFILLTVMGMPEDRIQGLEAGADDFLLKPIAPPELVGRLEIARRMLAMKAALRGTQRKSQNQELADVLIAQGVITRQQLNLVSGENDAGLQHLETALITREWATEEDITRARSVILDVPYVDLGREALDPFTLAMVSYEVAEKYMMIPLSLQETDAQDSVKRLRVAMADPCNIEAIDLIHRDTRRRAEPLLASKSAIQSALRRAYHNVKDVVHNAAMTDAIQQADVEQVSPDEDLNAVDPTMLLKQSDQAPVVRFVNTLFADAVYRRASDIHLEPGEKDFQIIYRIDGQMRPIRTITRSFLAPVVSRVKIMADMDITERRLPQDGHIALRIGERSVDLRVSTLPMQFGERLVIRVLDRSAGCFQMDTLGLSEINRRTLTTLIHKPHGIVLVTGPTGSGKTTTLYAALNQLIPSPLEQRRRLNILTCEDPIEYQLPGISQSNVSEKTGLTFARQLRAILRQDPDVILIGEIRDGETADIAFRAAMTGHLVLSTLHCNEAAGAVSRLIDVGVAPYLIASTLAGVVAQRLVPRLCLDCRKPYEIAPEHRALYADYPDPPKELYQPFGCSKCDGLGVRGRIAIHEVLTINDEFSTLVMEKSDTPSMREAAIRNGMQSMLADGLEKAANGLVFIDDILQKTGNLYS